MVRNLIPTVNLNLPATKKKSGFTQKEFETWIANRPSYKESNGAFQRLVDQNNINNKKFNATETRTALKKGSSNTKVTPKKDKIIEYLDDHRILYEKENATKAEVEAAHKRQDARDKKLEKKYVAEKPKSNGKYIAPTINLDSFDWDMWLRQHDKNYETLEEEEKIATKPVEENLYEQYMNMLQGGELLPDTSFEKFEREFLNLDAAKKVKKEVQKIADAKKRIEGLASLLGERTTDI